MRPRTIDVGPLSPGAEHPAPLDPSSRFGIVHPAARAQVNGLCEIDLGFLVSIEQRSECAQVERDRLENKMGPSFNGLPPKPDSSNSSGNRHLDDLTPVSSFG
jgi:hypothetical protein